MASPAAAAASRRRLWAPAGVLDVQGWRHGDLRCRGHSPRWLSLFPAQRVGRAPVTRPPASTGMRARDHGLDGRARRPPAPRDRALCPGLTIRSEKACRHRVSTPLAKSFARVLTAQDPTAEVCTTPGPAVHHAATSEGGRGEQQVRDTQSRTLPRGATRDSTVHRRRLRCRRRSGGGHPAGQRVGSPAGGDPVRGHAAAAVAAEQAQADHSDRPWACPATRSSSCAMSSSTRRHPPRPLRPHVQGPARPRRGLRRPQGRRGQTRRVYWNGSGAVAVTSTSHGSRRPRQSSRRHGAPATPRAGTTVSWSSGGEGAQARVGRGHDRVRADQTPSRLHTVVDADSGAVISSYDEVETGPATRCTPARSRSTRSPPARAGCSRTRWATTRPTSTGATSGRARSSPTPTTCGGTGRRPLARPQAWTRSTAPRRRSRTTRTCRAETASGTTERAPAAAPTTATRTTTRSGTAPR